jgi:glycosyltransferase involved in cell wall biosynthesis
MAASKLPIVCSDIPVFRTIFTDPESAYFFEVNNYRMLVSQIEKLSRSKRLREDQGKKAKKIAENYSLKKTIAQHELYYEMCDS